MKQLTQSEMKLFQALKKMPLTFDNRIGKYVIRAYEENDDDVEYKVDIDALSINELSLSLKKPLNRLLKAGLIAYVIDGTKQSIKLL